MRKLWVAAALAVACGGDGGDDGGGGGDDPPAPFSSGERLTAVYWDGGDGATALRRWRDTELGIDCRLRPDAAGQLRCMPDEGGYLLYLADDCTDPAVEANACAGPPSAMIATEVYGDCGGYHVEPFAVGETVSQATSYSIDAMGECVENNWGEPRSFHRLTPVAPAMFAAATLRRVELDSGLGVELAEFEGGGHQLWGAVSLAHDRTCSPNAISEGGTERCLPGSFGWDYGSLHQDDACTGADVAYSLGCEPPDFIFQSRRSDDECAGYQLVSLRTAGEPLDAAAVYEGSGASCGLVTPRRGSFWTVGPVADLDLPAVSRAPLGDGRLQVEHYATPEGAPISASGNLRDSQTGAECAILDAGADGLRCVTAPYTHPSSNLVQFRDDQCTDQLIQVHIPDCGELVMPELYLHYEIGACGAGPLLEVRELGPLYTGPVYQGDTEGTSCVPYTVGPNEQFHTRGAPRSLADYPAILERP